jgi:hypothetical protein
MKRLFFTALSVVFCLGLKALPVNESNILGSYLLTTLGSTDTGRPLGHYFTLFPDHVDFVFDGEPSVVSQCASSWTLENSILTNTLDCTLVFPNIRPMVIKMDLSGVSDEILSQAKGFEVNAEFSGLSGKDQTWNSRVIITKVQQGSLELSQLTIQSGEDTGLKRRDTDLGCCLDDDCTIDIPCREAELDYGNGRVNLRLVFDTNVENLDSIDLFQRHLRRAYLSVGFEITSQVLEFATLQVAENINFRGLNGGRLQFTISGIIDKLERVAWEGGINGRQVYEKIDTSIPYNINFELEILGQ